MKLKDFAVLGAGILVLAICVYGLSRNAFLAQADEVLTPPPAGESGSAMGGIREDHFLSATDAPLAPALAAGTWINSPSLKLSDLRGKVVLVEFWTFACYNCRNTLPSVKSWDSRYRDSGLTTIGVHTPEMKSERDLANVRRETQRLGIRYPVVTDNDYQTWRAYDIEAWPTILILDKQGRVRWKHVGEGSYDETEGVIRKLLGENVSAAEQKTTSAPAKSAAAAEPEQITKTDEEWRQILTPEQYYITREHGTEAPFSGAYYDNHDKGTYLCVACSLPLFSSETKFESGTGWPSFYQPISARNIKEFTDQSLGMDRTEVVCRRCGAHLGHVFDDGPPPTHLRYCLNSLALKFVKGS